MKKCITPGCKNKAVIHKNYCHTCRNHRWIRNNPLKYLFITRKANAKRRNKEWSLTYDEFLEFCKQTGYDIKCGRHANDMSIDRIESWRGYHKDNIRSITISDNVKRERGVLLDIDNEFQISENECPF
jgi:hypothetical protein